MNVESNNYTIGFGVVMAILVALLLAFASNGLSTFQKANIKHEKIVNLFAAVGQDIKAMEKTEAEMLYNKKFTGFLVSNSGEKSGDKNDAFKADMAKEIRNPLNEQRLPVFVYTNDGGEKQYVLQSRGNG